MTEFSIIRRIGVFLGRRNRIVLPDLHATPFSAPPTNLNLAIAFGADTVYPHGSIISSVIIREPRR